MELIIGDKKITSKGKSDFLICQFNESGKIVWTEKFGGKSSDHGISISSLSNGNIIIGGNFQGIVETSRDTLVSSGFYDIAFLSYNKNYGLRLLKQLGNEYGDFLRSFVIGDSTIYFTGNFRDAINVDFLEISSKGSDDILIGSFSNLGLFFDSDPNINSEKFIQIRPNPSKGIIELFSNYEPNTKVDITITDKSGRITKEIDNIFLNKIINLSFLTNGTYLIHFQIAGGRSHLEKMIVVH